MTLDFNKQNFPNPSRLITSLRHLGYDNYIAIADIVDNCLDANADNIFINIGIESSEFKITIADNGTGMEYEILDQALRLGSLTEKDPVSELGKFGMGLVTAGLSLARKTTVITKSNGNYYTSITDVDEIVDRNEFCKYLEKSNSKEIDIFTKHLPDCETGTVIIFEKCDGIKNKNSSAFASTLRKNLGRIHRYFIRAGKNIFINDQKVEVEDPLEIDNPNTEVFSDEEYPFKIKRGGKDIEENIRIRIVLIPDDISGGERQIGANIKNQGFYVMRNNREIKSAVTLDAFTKHNDFNRLRGEVFISGELDSIIGIDFTKRDIVFDQSFQDQFLMHVKSQCTTLRSKVNTEKKTKQTTEIENIHRQAEKYIDQKSKLLITPKSEIEKRKSPTDESSEQSHTNKSKRTARTPSTKQHVETSRCRFEAAKFGPNGQIYECHLEGRTIVIRWNIEHPFYDRFLNDQKSNDRISTAVDYLVYSMASAELHELNDDNIDFINSYKTIFSSNLRTLLS